MLNFDSTDMASSQLALSRGDSAPAHEMFALCSSEFRTTTTNTVLAGEILRVNGALRVKPKQAELQAWSHWLSPRFLNGGTEG
jgi:hypothetical protein